MVSLTAKIHFPSLNALKRKAASLGWVSFKHAEDERGFYPTEVELDPKVAALIEAQDAKARAARIAREAVEPAAPAKERKARPINLDGPVHRIRAWARENPDATPAEAVAHFPDLHPATVKIQQRKVRLGEV